MVGRDARSKQLQAMADRNGARLVANGSRLALVRNDVSVEVLFDAEQPERQTVTWRATPRPPGTVRFKVYPEGLRSLAVKAIFGEDIEVGLGSFDLQFMVTGTDAAAIRRIWTRTHCGEMLADFAEGKVASDGATIALECHLYVERHVLDAGYRLVHGLASVDLFGFAALLALPGAVEHVSADERYVTLPGPADLRVGAFRDARGTVVTRISAHVPDPDESWVAAETKAHGLGGRLSHRRDEAVLVFGEIVVDRKRLGAAIELMRSLGAVAPQGIFR